MNIRINLFSLPLSPYLSLSSFLALPSLAPLHLCLLVSSIAAPLCEIIRCWHNHCGLLSEKHNTTATECRHAYRREYTNIYTILEAYLTQNIAGSVDFELKHVKRGREH